MQQQPNYGIIFFMSLDPALRLLGCDFPQLSPSLHRGLDWCSWVGQIVVPAGVGLYALKKNDFKGFFSLGSALVINQIFLELMKKFISCARPNGRSGSFPSGHTAAAVLGVVFLASRYGLWEMQFPVAVAGVVALAVGISRVVLRAHWVHDVVAGALLGTVIAYAWTSKVYHTSVKSSLFG